MQKDYQLQQFNPDDFLQTYWQNKPSLLKKAIPDFDNPISPEELAGLACEEDVESRIISEVGGEGAGKWQLEHGPFAEDSFPDRPTKDWTLLVQAVDHYVPDVAELLEYFRFIPNWRIDDVMVSFAAEGGSVGPHFDQYDVFLIQGSGTRQWKIGQRCTASTPLLAHPELSVLEHFETSEEFIAEPGDIVYIPPGVAHWGTSLSNDCMTYSVGFRAPSHSEILSYFCDHLIDQLDSDPRYQDKSPTPSDSPGEINSKVIDHLFEIIQSASNDKQSIGHWFGEFMTLPKYPVMGTLIDLEDADLEPLLQETGSLYRDNAARFAYLAGDNNIRLFINGESFEFDLSLAKPIQYLCDNTTLSVNELTPLLSSPTGRTVLLSCLQYGFLSAE